MKIFFITVFLTNVHQFYCIQNLYSFVPERCDISDVNNTLFTSFTYKCTKINRNSMYLNVSFTPIENLSDDNEAEILVRTYMFRSNEYRQGPIEFAMKFCSAFKRQDFDIPNLLANSNLKCPILKNHNYYVYNFAPNATNFPPLIPEGRWKLQLVFKYRHKYNMAVLNWYMGVVYNVPFDPSL